ncbi:hypothetical protein ACA910_017458 [Epithemia clementina (nom. ined.)]
MKFLSALLVAVMASTASAFVPASFSSSSQQTFSTFLSAVDLNGMAGSTLPIKAFDPLGYGKLGGAETLNWFRASELKHGRAAMLATTGFLVQAAGIHFPGYLSEGVTFESLSGLHPVDQWAAVSDAGKWQIIGAIFVAESYAELQKPHYMMGGPTAELIWPKVDTSAVSPDVMLTKQNRELNNGRLAMIAIMSFLSEHAIPGSVPLLANIEAFH